MIVRTHLTEPDFIKANFVLLYKKTFARLITGAAIFVFIVSIMGLGTTDLSTSSWTDFIVPIGMLIWLPIITYFSAKKNYSSNRRICEVIEYNFERDFLSIKGESFSTRLTWDKIYKVSKTKNWIFIWQSKQIVNVISKQDLSDNEIKNLKSIVESYKLKNNL